MSRVVAASSRGAVARTARAIARMTRARARAGVDDVERDRAGDGSAATDAAGERRRRGGRARGGARAGRTGGGAVDGTGGETRAAVAGGGETRAAVAGGGETRAAVAGGGETRTSAAVALNKALGACESVEALVSTAAARARSMSGVNASTTYAKLAKFSRAGRSERAAARDALNSAWFCELETRAMETMNGMNPRAAAQLVWACGHLGLNRSARRGGDAFWDELERALERLGEKFEPQGVANIAWAYAKLEMRMPNKMRNAFEAHLMANANAFKPYELSISFWALTKNGEATSELVVQALERALQLPACKPQELANVASALARVKGSGSRGFLKRLASESSSRLKQFTNNELAMLLWGLSNAGSQLEDADAAKIFEEVRRRRASLSPREVSLIVGAFATFNDGVLTHLIDCDDEVVADSWCPAQFEESTRLALRSTLSALEEVFLASIKESNAADLGFIIWAFARLSHRPSDEFVIRFEDEAVSKLDDCSPKHIANLLYGFSRLKLRGMRLFTNATFCIWQRSSEFTPIEIFTVCSALASENHDPGAHVMVQLERTVLKSLDSLDSAALTEFLRVFAKLRYMLSSETFERVGQRSATTLDRYDSYRMSMTLWSHATLCVQPHEDMLARFTSEVRGAKKPFLKHNFGLALWSLTVLASLPSASPNVERLMRAIISLNEGTLNDSNGLPEQTLSGLYMARLIAVGRSFEDVVLRATDAIAADCESVWLVAKTQDPTTSNLQRAVAEQLRELGADDFEIELPVEGGKIRPDIVFAERRLVVEVDGPHHYSVDAAGNRHELGQTVVRDELLRSWGWRVCVIPYHDWSELVGDVERADYLRARVLSPTL